jgi:outer membrane protein TolC
MHWLLIGVMIFTGSVKAKEVISWKECVNLTLKNNAELQSARAALESFQYQEGAAKSGFLPQLSANLGATEGNSSTTSSLSGGGNSTTTTFVNTSQNNTNYSASISATQNLFSGLQDLGKVRQAKANTKANESSLQITKAKISYDLKSNYEGLIYANLSRKLTEEITRRREDNMSLVELRFESGRENKGSVLLSRAYLNQAQYENLQATNANEVAHAQLARVLGLDEYSSFQIYDPIPTSEPGNSPIDYKEIVVKTPEFLQSIAQEEAAEAAVVVARSSFFPILNLTGIVGKQGPDFFPQNDRWSVGINLSFPFFSGMKDYHSIKSTSSLLTSSSNNRINIHRQLLAKLKQSYSAYIEAVTKFKVDESFQQASQLRAEIARNKYNNGLLTFEDWDIIENDLITRQKTYIQSKRDRVIAEAAWEQAQGIGVIP